MVGVPAASTATTLLLFALGALVVAIGYAAARRRLPPLGLDARVVALACAISLVALPWIGWRFVEDLRTTTHYDAYERANAGPIQAFLPGYLVDAARAVVPRDATWASATGPAVPYPVARLAFPSLVLVTLFPRPSAPVRDATWLVAWGVDPRRVARVSRVRVAHARLGPLPPVLLGKVAR